MRNEDMRCLAALQVLHDFATAAASLEGQRPLYVDGFDTEQIWLQLKQAGPSLHRAAHKHFRNVGPGAVLLDADTERDLDGEVLAKIAWPALAFYLKPRRRQAAQQHYCVKLVLC